MDKKVIYVSLIVLVLLICCITTVVFCKIHNYQGTKVNNHICIQSENGQLKCGTSTQLLTKYLDEIISKRYVDVKMEDRKQQEKHFVDNKARLMSNPDQSFWEAKPAAKLVGKKLHDSRQGDINATMTTVREWSYDREHGKNGFLRHGMRYRNGRLVVPVQGTYFVYSLVDFFEPCDLLTSKPDVQNSSKTIKHAIYKFNILEKAETEIIANVQPHQICLNKYYNSYNSYVSSLAYLKAGDEISVKFAVNRHPWEKELYLDLVL